jgi:hypothetical protein
MLEANSDPDSNMMRRCIAVTDFAGNEGEHPFAAVIARHGVFLCESINRVKRDHDVNSRSASLRACLRPRLTASGACAVRQAALYSARHSP